MKNLKEELKNLNKKILERESKINKKNTELKLMKQEINYFNCKSILNSIIDNILNLNSENNKIYEKKNLLN